MHHDRVRPNTDAPVRPRRTQSSMIKPRLGGGANNYLMFLSSSVHTGTYPTVPDDSHSDIT